MSHSLSRSMLYKHIRSQNWPRRRASGRAVQASSQTDLIGRLLAALDFKMTEFENRMKECAGAAPLTAADSERDARTLSTLVRLFEKLKDLDEKRKCISPNPNHNEAVQKAPHDADGIRNEFAQRLIRLREQLGG